MRQLIITLSGIYFGIVLVKSEVASWYRIQQMFLFKEAHMYLIITSAIVVGVISVQLIRRFHARSIQHEEIVLRPKPLQYGVIIGGTIFGLGWAITGACPGPIYAQIGAGEWAAVATFLGAILGMYGYAWLQPLLPHGEIDLGRKRDGTPGKEQPAGSGD